MARKLSAAEAANVTIQSIGCGYDMSLDVRLAYRKRRYVSDFGNNPYRNCRLLEIAGEGRDIVLPGGLLILNVPKSINCDEGESTRFQSGVLSFKQMSEQFNQEMSLSGLIPSGLFNAMFEFSGSWQKDASSTKTLAFDGVFVSLYTVALEQSQMVLFDHVKKAVPSSWEPALLARFIQKFGTHIIVGVTMGGKDVVYMKQYNASSLEPTDVENKLKAMADKRFLISEDSEHISENDNVQCDKWDLVSICKRRGGSDDRNLKHNEWLHTVQLEPDVVTMSFIPITSVLDVLRSTFLNQAIYLYLRYKPPIEELRQFFEFQIRTIWAPFSGNPPIGPQRKQRPQHKQQSTACLQFSFFGSKLYVNTIPVDVGKKLVTGLRLYLDGEKSNNLEIHLLHLASLPEIFQVEDYAVTGITNSNSDYRYYEKVEGKNSTHVCTAPVESEDEFSIVTGAQLQVEDQGFKKVLFLRLHFSKLLGCTTNNDPEWDSSPGQKSGITTSLRFPMQLEDVEEQGEPMRKFVDTTEMMRGPQDSPGYWVVTGARLVVENGKISLRVKYSLPRI